MMISPRQPLADGFVMVFYQPSGPPPVPEKYWRVPDMMIRTDADGRFGSELPEGLYYIGGIKRVANVVKGPPQEGDFFLPVVKEKGKPKIFRVRAGKTTLTGSITGAYPFSRNKLKAQKTTTAISGAVTDDEGKPVAGMIVFAFTDASMEGLPLFASEPTGSDGKYLLRVHEGRSYFLKARIAYGGGRPEDGEIIGRFGDRNAAHPVAVKTGSVVAGINITSRPVVRRPTEEGVQKQQRFK